MHINNLIIVVAVPLISSFSVAATLCVPGKDTGTYSAVNKQSECVYQEPVVFAAPQTSFSKEKDGNSELHAMEVETIPIKVQTHPVKLSEPLPLWTLSAGKSIGRELKSWGDRAGWKVIWNLSTDWTIPADTTYEGEFATVAASVIETLASNGALVRGKFYEGNKTMVINGPGIQAQ